LNNTINSFNLISTKESLDISQKIFSIQLNYIFRTLQESTRLKSILDKNDCFYVLFDKNISDSPRIRFWLTCTKELIKSLDSDIDPSPSSVSFLFVDDNHPDRVFELHLLELLGIWIDDRVSKKDSFELSLNIKIPYKLKIGSLGLINFNKNNTNKSEWKISFDGLETLTFSQYNNVILINTGQPPHSDNSNRDYPIVYEYNKSTFEIPVNDYALCEPYYANAAIIRDLNICKNWSTKVLYPALDILNKIDSQLTHECLLLSPVILPLHCGSIGFGSASSEDILGLIYLPGVDTKYDVAECLLHESLHQKLFRIESGINLFSDHSPTEEKYYSPWRADPRPLRMILHGSYVFTAIAEMWQRLAEEPSYNLNNGNPIFLATYRAQQAIEGIRIIKKFGNLKKYGQQLLDSIEENAESVIQKVNPSNTIDQDVNKLLKKHNDLYSEYCQ